MPQIKYSWVWVVPIWTLACCARSCSNGYNQTQLCFILGIWARFRIIYFLNIIHQDYELTWPKVLPQNKCRSLWPIFHVPVIWPFILNVIWGMNILIWENESVWPDVWPQCRCRSLWPVFHGQTILLYILKTIWCMNIILWYYWSVWHNSWPQNKCRSFWPIFYGLVILSYISNLMHECHIFR